MPLSVPVTAIVCRYCGGARVYRDSEIRVRKTIKFCSRACYKASRAVFKPCVVCRNPVKESRNLFCSRTCFAVGRRVPGSKWRDKEYIRDYMRRYASNNREEHNKRSRLWVKQNPEKKLAIHRARRAGMAAGDSMTPQQWRAMIHACGNRCLCCGKPPTLWNRLEADHVLPVSLGGGSQASNMQPLCQRCNRAKSARRIDYRTGEFLSAAHLVDAGHNHGR